MLLALETATDVCSVALVDEERRVVSLAETLEPRSHAARLVPLVRDLLAEHDLTTSDLAAVAVSAGPGSYTGLRIGASTAKGLAWATGADLVAVPSLDALAFGCQDVLAPGDLLVTAFRSRRGEVYAAAFRRDSTDLTPVAEAAALPLDALPDWLPGHGGTLWITGEAGTVVTDALPRPAHALDPSRFRPSALHIGAIGVAKLTAGETVDTASFEPDYLKDFVAKRGRAIFERLPK